VIGHSLGSIITWDILNHQNVGYSSTIPETPLRGIPSIESLGTGFFSTNSQSEPGSDGPESTSVRAPQELSMYPQLEFPVDNFFLLGSPVPVFLMIRNQRKPLSDDFYLRGCGRVFNIFHPYDPVAYRIEPCIDPRNADFEPTIIKHWNGGFRVQYRTRRIWRKLVETTFKTQRNVVEAFEQSMAGMGLLDATVEAGADDDSISEVSEDRTSNGVVTGQLNQGRRIDYMLQEKEIENANEYVAALAAHSSYWIEKDLSLFIARQMYLSSMERAAAAVEAADFAAWESITPEDMKM
jgi:DDHD domain